MQIAVFFNQHPKVLIIGSGVIGLTTAYLLLEKGSVCSLNFLYVSLCFKSFFCHKFSMETRAGLVVGQRGPLLHFPVIFYFYYF